MRTRLPSAARGALSAPEARLLAGEEAQDVAADAEIVSPVSSGRLSPRRRSPLRRVPFAEREVGELPAAAGALDPGVVP